MACTGIGRTNARKTQRPASCGPLATNAGPVLDAGGTGSAPPLDDAQAQQGTLERRLGARHIHITGTPFAVEPDTLLGAGTGCLRAGRIDLFVRFRRICKDGHPVVSHFQETAGDGEGLFLLRAADNQLLIPNYIARVKMANGVLRPMIEQHYPTTLTPPASPLCKL